MTDPFAAESPPPSPEWLLTYGDLMSLLLTFFILLASMADWNKDARVVEAVEAMQRRFGRETGDDPNSASRRGGANAVPVGARPWLRAYGSGRSVALGGAVLFAENATVLDEQGREQLRAIADQLRGKAQRIEIRAHTTRRPAAETSLGDQWDLAFARCREVERRLIADGIDPRRFRLSTAGGNEPAYVGDDPLGKRENSRVEVFLLDEFADLNEGTEKPPLPR